MNQPYHFEMQRFAAFLIFLFLQNLLSAQGNADCSRAMDICKKKTYEINHASGIGEDSFEADFIACFMRGEKMGQAEENSTWIKFEIEQGGSLTFTLTPHREDDDLDFVVFKLPANGDCAFKQIVRCMASGPDFRGRSSAPCMGRTGLRESETDSSEDAGCSDEGDNAWLAPLKTAKGEKYVILVSNVTSTGPGFSISFGGSAKLPCDEEKKPVADKPKPDKPVLAPPVATTPVPPAVPAALPDSIGGRKVELSETVKVKSRKIKVKIWDSQVEDGDVISVYLDDKKVIDRVRLRLKPQEYEIELPPGKEHYLTVYADDFGKAEPNTAKVLIFDGINEQTIDMVAGRKKQESVKIVAE